jgi:hypothetical protein
VESTPLSIGITENTPVVRRLRKCRRQHVYWARKPFWLEDLSSAYSRRDWGPRKICPHRGASLCGVPAVEGVVTCPLHGLRFDAKSGQVHEITGG